MRKLVIWVLWPAFVTAVIAEAFFFTLIDPQTLYLFGNPVTLPSMATYSVGFFFFWLLAIGASLMTYMMLPGTAKEILRQHTEQHDKAVNPPPG